MRYRWFSPWVGWAQAPLRFYGDDGDETLKPRLCSSKAREKRTISRSPAAEPAGVR